MTQFFCFSFWKSVMETSVEKDQAGHRGPGWGWNTVHWGSDLCGTWVSWPHILLCVHSLGTAKRHVPMQDIPAVTTANMIRWTWQRPLPRSFRFLDPGYNQFLQFWNRLRSFHTPVHTIYNVIHVVISLLRLNVVLGSAQPNLSGRNKVEATGDHINHFRASISKYWISGNISIIRT